MTTREASADILQALGLSPLEIEAILEISQTRRVKLQKYIKESLLYYSEYLLNNPEDITAPMSIDLGQYAYIPKVRS